MPYTVAIIGAGPAGLIAAEHLAELGHAVTVYDRMASPGRKLLLAGRGGLNLTHSEAAPAFAARYGRAERWMAGMSDGFSQAALVAWCEGLGQPVFTGSSGRIFPRALKAAPLLRAWLRRLDTLGVRLETRHRWLGWTDGGAWRFDAPGGEVTVTPDAVLLATGGASWPRMGSDGAWVDILRARCVDVADLRASNCGVSIAWSPMFAARFAGTPLKRIALSVGDHAGPAKIVDEGARDVGGNGAAATADPSKAVRRAVVDAGPSGGATPGKVGGGGASGKSVRGEAMITQAGLEGGAVYALSAPIRAALDAGGSVTLLIDLRPDIGAAALAARTDGARQGRSLSNFLRQAAGLPPVAIALVHEALRAGAPCTSLSALIKALPVRVMAMQPIERAISSAGGIRLDELDDALMIRRLPGVFAAGEMLDWEAPTGGYLLQGCFSTGVRAAAGIGRWLADTIRC